MIGRAPRPIPGPEDRAVDPPDASKGGLASIGLALSSPKTRPDGLPPAGGRLRRYILVSALNLVLGHAVLAFAFGILRWSAVSANLLAATVATVPTYLLYRRWVWQQTGRSHLRREVAPFLVVVVVGLVVVTGAADLGEAAGARLTDARLGQTVVVATFTLAACFALWAARFFFLDKFLFGAGRRPLGDGTKAG